MFFSTWLRNRKNSLDRLLTLHQKQKRRSSAHPLARTLLCLEVLEDRITPSGFQSLYSFAGGNDGKAPGGTLMVDANGNLIGTTSAVGANGEGTVFQLNPSSQALTTLHAFSTNSGYLTYQGLIHDSSGNLYGTTVFGGSANEGTVFELSPDGKTFTILHSFVNSTSGIGEGMNPEAPLIMDSKGDLFGTTGFGSLAGVGTVFELNPNGSGGYNYTTLHSFNGSTDGGNPACSLSMDSSGNLYGVAVQDGADGHGTVFKLSPNGSGGYNFSVVYTFTGGNDGAQPYSNIVMDSEGNLYGTTTIDGANSGGTAYEINPSNDTLTTIYNFKFPGGYNPTGNLVIDPKGNLYGVTEYGGSGGQGTAFELSPNGSSSFNLTTLHNFSGSDGGTPLGGLIADSNGNLYGTTDSGGTNNDGTIFEITGAINLGIHLSIAAPTYIVPGTPFSITVTALDGSNNVDTNYTGTVSFTSTDGSAVLPGSYTFTAGDQGVHTFTNGVTLNAQGNQTITATSSVADAPAGVTNWWPGDGNTNDIVGGDNGTLTGGATYGAGEVNQAFSFNGNNQYVAVSGSDTVTGTRTIEGWVYPTTNTGNGLPILTAGVSLQGDFFGVAGTTGTNNGTVQYDLYVDHWGFSTFHSSIALTPNAWNYVALTDDGSNLQFYVNGADAGIVSGSLYDYGINTFTIGGNTIGGSTTKSSFNGLIDELTLYNRALSQSEIQAIYDAGSSGKYLTSSSSVSVADGIVISPATLPTATVGTSYSQTLSASDPVPYTFAVTSGSLPTGLSLSSAGLLSGIPTATGSFPFTVTATDSNGLTGSQEYTLAVNAAVITTANSFSSTYTNTASQNLLLSATVANASIPTDTVNEGTVTFTVKDSKGNMVGSVVSGPVSSGKASANFTLPQAQAAGNYTIDVSYSDSTGNFVDAGDIAGTLTNDPSNADITAKNVTTAFSYKAQTLTLNANIADDLDPNETVGEGIVTFTVMNGSFTVGTVQGTVSSKDTASANFNLPAGTVPGSYTIKVSYSDNLDNFSNFLDTPATLTVTPASVSTTASNVATVYRVNSQTVKLSAAVADTSVPTDTVNEGIVTFTVMNGGATVGSVQGAVSGGKANANFSLSAGQALGNYSVVVSYKDSAGKFTDSSDTSSTLTVAPAQVATRASNVSTVYSSKTQTLGLSAVLSDASAPGDILTEGIVTFTVMNGSTPIGSVQVAANNGTASANFSLPGGVAIGKYTIGVSYGDSSGNFSDGGDSSGTLTISPANVVTTAAASNLTFNPAAQTVALNATLANTSITGDTVGEGTVTFTIKNSQIIVGSVTTDVSGGTASADFNWTPGRAAGNYTIAVSYQDSLGNYLDGGNTSNTLTVAPALVTTTAANASAVFSPNAQNVTLSASVASPNVVPISSLDTDSVTFTINNGNSTIGSVAGQVSNGTANATFQLPAGLAAGTYSIAVSYSDSHGNFIDGGDTAGTLTITSANVTTTATNATVIVPNSQSVTLNALVADSSIPTDTVTEGTVTFTVLNGKTVIGSAVQGTVSGGVASTNFAVPAGLTAGSYTIAVSFSDDTGNFSDSGDTSGTLTVLAAPTVTASPSDETVSAGGTAIFTAAGNGSPTLNVQWQVSKDGGKTFTNISGANSTTLTLGNVNTSQNGNEYQAVFSNSYGTATTSAATLTVPFAPTVTTNPSNQTAKAGQNVTFTAAANGSPTPTVQWQVSTDGGKTFTDISGATSATLTLTNVQASQNGDEYQTVFTNSLGTITTGAATLTVQYAPAVTTNPSSQTTVVGLKATFTAAANSNPTATVQWQVSTDGGKTFSDISGAVNPILTLAGLTTAMSGNEYQAVFTNSIGSTTTSAATLTVNPAVIPVIAGNPTSQTVSAGSAVSFTASANGDPVPSVQWQLSTDGGAIFSNINGATSITLTLTGVTPAMNGYKYQAVFSNSAGSVVSTPVTLTVNAPPPSQPLTLNVPPLLALLGQLMRGIETINANDTETVVYSLFGIALATANYDGSGNFVSGSLFGISLPNWVWNL